MNNDLNNNQATSSVVNNNLNAIQPEQQPVPTAPAPVQPQSVTPQPAPVAPTPVQPQPVAPQPPTVPTQETIQAVNTNNQNLTKVDIIPTIEQSESDFINNAQAISTETKEEEKSEGGLNYTFFIVLFIIVLLSIFFLFPIITKYI